MGGRIRIEIINIENKNTLHILIHRLFQKIQIKLIIIANQKQVTHVKNTKIIRILTGLLKNI